MNKTCCKWQGTCAYHEKTIARMQDDVRIALHHAMIARIKSIFKRLFRIGE